jgi:hypothetical protein
MLDPPLPQIRKWASSNTSTPPGTPRFAVCMDEKEDRKNKPILHPKTDLNISGRSFPKKKKKKKKG